MKKKILLNGLLIVLSIIALFFIYHLYSLKKLDSKVSSFNRNIKKEYRFVGMTDDRMYYLENNTLHCFDEKQQVFSRDIGVGIADIIYDRYIYVVEKSGSVSMLNRKNGNELKRINLERNIVKAVYEFGNIDLYLEDGVISLNQKLEKKSEIRDLRNPVSKSENGRFTSVIEINMENGEIISTFSIYENDKKIYTISSPNEAFLYTSMLDEGNSLLISNRYIYMMDKGVIKSKDIVENIKSVDYAHGKYAIVDGDKLKIFDKSFQFENEKKIDFDVSRVSIRKNSIVLIGKKEAAVFENDTIIKEKLNNLLGQYISSQGVYLIFENKIDKLSAY